MRLKDYLLAKTSLETLLKIDPDARLGDVSLLYGQALFELQDWETAKIHLAQDIRHWSHPESSLLLATILEQEGDAQAARDRLETMLARIQGSPIYHHRRHQGTIRNAKKMLKRL